MDGDGPRIAINGFGRIGRLLTRILLSSDTPVDLVAINDVTDNTQLAHLFRHDSIHGAYPGSVEVTDDGLVLDGDRLLILEHADPSSLPWKDLAPDLVIEATGKFHSKTDLQKHLDAGAPRVLLTSPGETDATIVRGVNDSVYDRQKHRTVSAASCTTNCLAPVLSVLHPLCDVQSALMTTIHAVTGDQRLLDAPHSDLRRARAAMGSMIPTKTGAATSIGKVMPELDGRVDGQSIRVPTMDVSLLDLVAKVGTPVDQDVLMGHFRTAAAESLAGILRVEDEPLVSVDFTGDSHSAIVDVQATQIQGDLVRVMAWYDNEWGYANRVVELAHRMTS